MKFGDLQENKVDTVSVLYPLAWAKLENDPTVLIVQTVLGFS